MGKWDQLKRKIRKLQGLYLFALVLLLSGCGKVGNTDTWVVEVHVLEKETVTREDKETGSEVVYLLSCEDASGSTQVFELTDTALDGKFEAEKAFKELRTGKYYKFRVGWRGPGIEGRAGHHPSIYGAVKMEGFNLEYLPNNIEDGTQSAETADTSQAREEQSEEESSPSREQPPEEALRSEGESSPSGEQPSEEILRPGGQPTGEALRSGGQPTEGIQQTEGNGQKESPFAEAESSGELQSERGQEDIEAELEESFAAERESLAREQESLEAKLLELEQELKGLEGAGQ